MSFIHKIKNIHFYHLKKFPLMLDVISYEFEKVNLFHLKIKIKEKNP